MDSKATIAELKYLLELLPSVRVESTDLQLDMFSLTLQIGCLESIGPVAYAAQGANIVLDLWTIAQREPAQSRSDPTNLRFRIVCAKSGGSPAAFLERAEFFGLYLVWYLRGVDLLSEDQASRYLQQWKGVARIG